MAEMDMSGEQRWIRREDRGGQGRRTGTERTKDKDR
jgi:hypothetical protein